MEPGVAVRTKEAYEDEYFRIRLDEEDRLLSYKIVGYPKFSDMIRHGHDELYKICRDMQREGKAPLHLAADLTEAKILLMKDIRFIGAISYPRLGRTGVRNLAILLTDDFHVKTNVQKTLEFMGPRVFQAVNLLSSLEQARGWFRSLPEI